MPDPRVKAVFHTGITVSDIHRSIKFYGEALGLEMSEIEPRYSGPEYSKFVGVPNAEIDVVYAKAPNHILEILSYHKPEDRLRYSPLKPYDAGNVHVGFSVENIDAMIERVRKYGAEASDPIEITKGIYKGVKGLYVRDPDGVILEIMELPSGTKVGSYQEP